MSKNLANSTEAARLRQEKARFHTKKKAEVYKTGNEVITAGGIGERTWTAKIGRVQMFMEGGRRSLPQKQKSNLHNKQKRGVLSKKHKTRE